MSSDVQKNKYYFRFYTAIFKNAEFRRFGHLQLRIVLVLSGTLNMNIGDKEYEIPEGYGVFIPSLESHSFHSSQSNTFRIIEFSREYLDTVFSYAKGKNVINHLFKYSDAVKNIITEYANFNGFSDNNSQIQAILAPLAYEICCHLTFKDTLSDTSTLLKIFNFVEEHFNEEINLSSVGAALGIHPVSVSRILSKSTGTTFSYYLRYVRCTRAAKHIIAENMTFSEIAFSTGFGSIRSFNRAFLEIYGKPPKEYKKSFKQTISNSENSSSELS